MFCVHVAVLCSDAHFFKFSWFVNINQTATTKGCKSISVLVFRDHFTKAFSINILQLARCVNYKYFLIFLLVNVFTVVN